MYWKALTPSSSSSVMEVAFLTSWIFSGVTSPMTRAANAGPGKGIRLKIDAGSRRTIIIRGNGREKHAFLISNDFDTPSESLFNNYARRWRVENVISEAVKCFNLNALSSPILVKVHFDVIMTMMADTLYIMVAKKLRGFESCDAAKIYRLFVNDNLPSLHGLSPNNREGTRTRDALAPFGNSYQEH